MDGLAAIVDFDDPDFDPFVADEDAYGDIADTHDRLKKLRAAHGNVIEGEPLALLGLTADTTFSKFKQFSVLGYHEIAKVDSDFETFDNDIYKSNLGLTFGNSLSIMNPPIHTRYRRIFQRAFLPHVVARLGDQFVAPVVNALIDGFIDRGEADLVNDFTLHYPFQVIYRQLALPQADIATFHRLAVTQTQTIGPFLGHAMEASRKLGDYFTGMIAERRKTPGDDLVSELLTAEVDGEHLPEDVIVSFLRQLINAGGDTTYRATGTLLTGLLSTGQYEEVKCDRSLIPAAIEEALRWDGPVIVHIRSAAKDTELGGLPIPKGSMIHVMVGAAGRDPAVFEDPDRYDLHRPKMRNFGFGHGPHMCIGQHLARLEMTRAMHALLDRVPNLRLDPDKPAPEVRGAVVRAPRHLHVRFG